MSTKQIQKYLSKIKLPNKRFQFQFPSCKHVNKTSVDDGGEEKEDDTVSLAEIDKFLLENFRSLYDKEQKKEEISTKTDAKTLESPRLPDHLPPVNLCRSSRFFIDSGLSSSRIVDEASSSFTTGTNDSSAPSSTEATTEISEDGPTAAPEDFIALLTYSPSPYDDFRQSMQEMVEARVAHNGKVDWQFLEELLFCYMELNNKTSHRYVLRAFVDLIVFLRENSGRSPASTPPGKGGARQRRFGC